MTIREELGNRGIVVNNVTETSDSIIITADSKFSDVDANMNIVYSVFPDGRYKDKDVMIKLNESEIENVKLNENAPHPSLIEEGDRVTIDHKTFGTISVVVKKVKRWNRDNGLDGVYYSSKNKGIFGFVSFDNIKRYYKNN